MDGEVPSAVRLLHTVSISDRSWEILGRANPCTPVPRMREIPPTTENTMNDWQTWAAAAAVILALLFLAARLTRKKGGKSSCGHDCGCDKK